MINIDNNTKVGFRDDDIWLNGDLISRCQFEDVWIVFDCSNEEKEFETLEKAVAYCLEKKP